MIIEIICDAVAVNIYFDSDRNAWDGFVATQTDRFASIIASAAPADLSSSYGAFIYRTGVGLEEGVPLHGFAWLEGGQGRMGAPPWRDPERYRRNSPLSAVNHIKTPLLLIHGTSDYVPVTLAERMFASLYRLGRDAQLLRYWAKAISLRARAISGTPGRGSSTGSMRPRGQPQAATSARAAINPTPGRNGGLAGEPNVDQPPVRVKLR